MRLCFALLLPLLCFAQNPPKPEPDTLLFNNGEKLVGKVVRSTGGSLTFHSDSVGDITVDWSKVKELHAAGDYAVLGKSADLKRAQLDSIPQGKISMTDQKINVQPASGSTTTIPVPDSGQIVDEGLFRSSIATRPGVFQKWTGAVNLGASLVQATQSSKTYTGAINLTRSIPAEAFLERQSRSIVNITGAFGSTRQPGTVDVLTEIFHADAEHDIYFSPRAYGFGQLSYDHNYSQGLNLQQVYSLGVGWTVVKQANQELDLKTSAGYEKQQFSTGGVNQNLFTGIFNDTYLRKLGKAHNILFQQQLTLSPAWSNLNAYSANGTASLTIPVYKRLNFTISVTDAFVNNPPPGFRKNSFQAATGLTYTLQ